MLTETALAGTCEKRHRVPMPLVQDQSCSPACEPFPLRVCEEEHFARVRSYFREAQYTEASLCRILGLSELKNFAELDSKQISLRRDGPPQLLLLVKLFFLMLPVSARDLEDQEPAEFLQSLMTLDLLRLLEGLDGEGRITRSYSSPVWLYPVQDLLIVSDQGKDSRQAVFPALGELTNRFLRLLETASSPSALDLCSGSGIAGLLLSRRCQRVAASDISERAVHFARFNCLLNSCKNVEIIQSDFYSALDRETFDLIVAHPPYVPSLSNNVVWRDGGETGENAICQIVEGLVHFLRPGGTFLSACAGFDTETQHFEERVRGWLGAAHLEFEIIFAVRSEIRPRRLALDLTEVSPELEVKDIRTLEECFKSIGACRHLNGALYIFRKLAGISSKQEPITLRTRLSPISDAASFAWIRRWLQFRNEPDSRQKLRWMKPRISSQLQMRVTHVVKSGALVPTDYILASGRPFLAETLVEPGMVKILEEFNGQRTIEELFELGRLKSMVPETLDFDNFLEFCAKMIERGYAEIDDPLLSE